MRLSIPYLAIALFLVVNKGNSIPIAEPKYGSITIRAFSETFDDPALIEPGYNIFALLDIVYPDGTNQTIVTDELGYYKSNTFIVGEYKIRPRYFSEQHEIKVFVTEKEETFVEIRIPKVGLYYFVINPEFGPLDTWKVRTALANAIRREGIVEKYPIANTPAYDLIPNKMKGVWSESAMSYCNDCAIENPFEPDSEYKDISILFNESLLNRKIAEDIRKDWISVFNSERECVNVILKGDEWYKYYEKRDVLREFNIVRAAWILESNNMLTFYQSMTYIRDEKYNLLLEDAEFELASSNFEGFDRVIVKINDYLIDNSLIIPIFNY